MMNVKSFFSVIVPKQLVSTFQPRKYNIRIKDPILNEKWQKLRVCSQPIKFSQGPLQKWTEHSTNSRLMKCIYEEDPNYTLRFDGMDHQKLQIIFNLLTCQIFLIFWGKQFSCFSNMDVFRKMTDIDHMQQIPELSIALSLLCIVLTRAWQMLQWTCFIKNT